MTKTHDEGVEKKWEYEMSWVCERSEHRHQSVPRELIVKAEKDALAAIEAEEMGDD